MPDNQSSAWAVGWAGFAGFMLILAGIMEGLNGLAALFNDQFFVKLPNYTFRLDVTAWGWIHLIIGLILVGAGVGIFKGHILGRTVGVIAAGVSIIGNFMWLPYYPVWSIVAIAIGIAVIWALTAHGRDIATAGLDDGNLG